MANINDVLTRYKKLDLHNQAIITEAVRLLKPIGMKELEEAYRNIYLLPRDRTMLLVCIINELEVYNCREWIDEEEKNKLLKFIEIGTYLCKDW